MNESRQLTKTFNGEQSSPSNAWDAEKARSIAALLNRLALHCPVRNLPEGQDALLMQDTISDLMGYSPQRIAQACDAWRRGPVPFFPTSGQLIDAMPRYVPSSWDREPYRAPQIEGPPVKLRPYREILAEHRKALPVSETEKPPAPAQQEQLEADGSLSPERREQLKALRETLAGAQTQAGQ